MQLAELRSNQGDGVISVHPMSVASVVAANSNQSNIFLNNGVRLQIDEPRPQVRDKINRAMVDPGPSLREGG